MLKLHEKFGDVVRIAPDELAFSHPDAWRDVMGHKNGMPEMGKAAWFYRPVDQALHIVNEDQIPHKQLRRQMAYGFSEKGMREQESMMRQYVDKLLIKLGEFAELGKPVVLSDWYNFTTFDIIGDLAFGEPFGCLDGSNYDDWVQSIFDSGRLGTILQALYFFPLIKKLVLSFVPKSLKEAQQRHTDLTKAKMLRRMAMNEERPDLIEGLLRKKDELVSEG
jgi:cytochrome P450